MAEIRLDELLWSDQALKNVAIRGLAPCEMVDPEIARAQEDCARDIRRA
jgi:hypothetical protein